MLASIHSLVSWRCQYQVVHQERIVMNRRCANYSVLATFLIAASAPPAHAQFFGPKNFEDCVLTKMKGQPPNMVQIARAACLREFPAERLLSSEEAEATWCATTDESISACLKLKPGFKVTKARANFSRTPCESVNLTDNMFSDDQLVDAKIPLFGSTFKFETKDAGQYKCARFLFYGHAKE